MGLRALMLARRLSAHAALLCVNADEGLWYTRSALLSGELRPMKLRSLAIYGARTDYPQA